LRKALSTLETIVADFGDCHRKRRLSPNSATVAVFGDSRRRQIVAEFVAEIGDYSLHDIPPREFANYLPDLGACPQWIWIWIWIPDPDPDPLWTGSQSLYASQHRRIVARRAAPPQFKFWIRTGRHTEITVSARVGSDLTVGHGVKWFNNLGAASFSAVHFCTAFWCFVPKRYILQLKCLKK